MREESIATEVVAKSLASQPGRRMVNFIATQKDKHSKKPDELYDMIEQCSPGPFVELFARNHRPGWVQWGDEAPLNGNGRKETSPRKMRDGVIRPFRITDKRQILLIS